MFRVKQKQFGEAERVQNTASCEDAFLVRYRIRLNFCSRFQNTSIRIVWSLHAEYALILHQMGRKDALLKGILNENICMTQSSRYNRHKLLEFPMQRSSDRCIDEERGKRVF